MEKSACKKGIASTNAVTPVNEQVRPRHVGTGIAAQIYVRALELFRVPVAAHGNHTQPQVLRLLVHEVRQAGIDIPRRDTVNPGKIPPLIRQRLGKVNAPRLGHIVARLLLRIVRNMARHTARDDEAALAPLLEVRADSLRAVKRTRQIRLDHLRPVIHRAIQDPCAGGTPRIRDEGVDLPELGDHVRDQLLDALPVAHVALVGLGLDAVGFGDLGCVLLAAFRAGGVCEGDVGAHFRAATGGFDAHAAGAGRAGHHHGFALQAEEVEEGGGGGDGDRHF